MTLEEVLQVLTEAKEYDELPVRHNEDLLNEELAKLCPIKVRKKKKRGRGMLCPS